MAISDPCRPKPSKDKQSKSQPCSGGPPHGFRTRSRSALSKCVYTMYRSSKYPSPHLHLARHPHLRPPAFIASLRYVREVGPFPSPAASGQWSVAHAFSSSSPPTIAPLSNPPDRRPMCSFVARSDDAMPDDRQPEAVASRRRISHVVLTVCLSCIMCTSKSKHVTLGRNRHEGCVASDASSSRLLAAKKAYR